MISAQKNGLLMAIKSGEYTVLRTKVGKRKNYEKPNTLYHNIKHFCYERTRIQAKR